MTDPAPDYLALSLGEFLDRVGAREPAPGGGAVAAVSVAMAAGLAEMAARFVPGDEAGAKDLVRRAQALRRQVVPLAGADARAYGRLLQALRQPAEPDPAARRRAVDAARSEAAAVPLAIAEAGVEAARLAADLARRGNPNLRGDAVAAALLAEASARAAAVLVRINLGATGDDRIARAQELAEAAQRAAQGLV